MVRLRDRSLFASALLLPLLVFTTAAAHGQANATGDRTIGVSVFAGGSAVKTDYNSTDKGFTVGGDVTAHLRLFDPSFEVRYTSGTGSVVNQSSFCTGLKFSRRIGPVHPYADFEVGGGNLTLQQPVVYPGGVYLHDNSFVYAFGGGLDIPVTHSVDVKAELQEQLWNLGTDNSSFQPVVVTLGLVYRLPYKRLPGRR